MSARASGQRVEPPPRRHSGGGGGAPAPAGMTGRDILRILRKRRWMILISVAGSAVLSFLVTLLWLRYAPSYTARASLAVNPPSNGLLNASEGILGTEIERIKQDHVKDIKDVKRQSLLREAAKDIVAEADKAGDPQQYSWVNWDRGNLVRRLSDALSVASVRDTSKFEIALTSTISRDQERAELAEMVTLIARAYVRDARNSITNDRRSDLEKLESERRTLAAELEQKNVEIARILRNPDVGSKQDRRLSLNITIEALTREATELAILIERAKYAREGLEGQSDGANCPEVLAMLDQDSDLRALLSAEVSWAAELATAQDKFGPQHRKVQDVQARLDNVRASIQSKRQELIERNFRLLKEQRTAMEASATARREEIQRKLNNARQEAAGLQADLNNVDRLTADAKNKEANIARIDNRLVELRLQRAGDQPVYIRGEAEIPEECSSPRWSVTMPLGVLLGLMASLGLAFVLEFMDTSIRSPSDLVRRLDLPALGMVPHTADLDEACEDARLAFQLEGDSVFGEAFRQIRTGVLFSCPPEQRRSLVVTSPLPLDGRTTVAMNLAAAIARGGRSVLVVDANFRQPALHKLFPQSAGPGLSDALTGQHDWASRVCRVQENLDILPAGTTPPNPAELLGGEHMKRILDEMVRRYDQVLLDAAPCLVVSDAVVLAAQADAVLLVARAGANTQGILQRCRDMFTRIHAHMLGAVLNAVRVTTGGYLRKNYEVFYGYRENGDGQAQNLAPAVQPALTLGVEQVNKV